MHHAAHVRGLERGEDAHRDAHRFGRTQRARLVQLVIERAPLDDLHDEVRLAVRQLAEVGDTDDAGVVDAGRGLAFAHEASRHRRVRGDRRVEELHRHRPALALAPRAVDDPHRAPAELALDHVRADARRDRRVARRRDGAAAPPGQRVAARRRRDPTARASARRRTRPGPRRRAPAAVRTQRSRPTGRGPRAERGGRRRRSRLARAHVEHDRAPAEDQPHLGVLRPPPASRARRSRRRGRARREGRPRCRRRSAGRNRPSSRGEPPGRGGALRNGSGGMSPRRRHHRRARHDPPTRTAAPGPEIDDRGVHRPNTSRPPRLEPPGWSSALEQSADGVGETSTDGWNLSLAA